MHRLIQATYGAFLMSLRNASNASTEMSSELLVIFSNPGEMAPTAGMPPGEGVGACGGDMPWGLILTDGDDATDEAIPGDAKAGRQLSSPSAPGESAMADRSASRGFASTSM